MSDLNTDQNDNSKDSKKEESFNLVESIMSQNYSSQHTQQNTSNDVSNKTNSKSNSLNNSGNSSSIEIMKEMKSKITNNDYNSIKELLKNSSNLTLQSKNQLLNLSFSEYNKTNNKNQRKIIVELINYGADPNHKLKLDDSIDKNKSNKSNNLSYLLQNIRINPLIYCCLKGDYELYEMIKNKVNKSTINEESSNILNHNPNSYSKNYLFYLFDTDNNMENKYKIVCDVLLYKKNTNDMRININEYNKKNGMTLLMMSIIKQYINFINLFLENGADINAKNLLNGNTALHYATLTKNKEIIELLLNTNNCNLLIKNNDNETVVDIVFKYNLRTEIYSLLAAKYTEQQKLLEGQNNQNEINNNENKNINYGMNNKNMNSHNYNNGYINSNMNMNNMIENDNTQGYDDGYDVIKKNQVYNNVEQLSSYLEIPIQFVKDLNYINFYDSNNDNNNNQNNNFDFDQNKMNNNDTKNIKNFVRFNNTPVLTINLKSEEDQELLILDNLKNENDNLDLQFEEIESRLEKAYNEHNKLLSELNKVNNEIKSVNNELDSYSKQIKELEFKNSNEIKNINMQKNAENSIIDILLSQENFLNLKNYHNDLLKNEDYLNKKFSDEIFDENQIKSNLYKDIIDFQKYTKTEIKKRQKPISHIRSALQERLELSGYDYTVNVFGSYATGLCLPWSDLDLILISKSQNMKNTNSVIKLQEIMGLLQNIEWVNTPMLVTDYYAFPFITFSTDQEHEYMKVNLTIQDKKNNGYKCVKLVREFINSYKNLEPLTLIVKQLMKCSNTLFSLSNYSSYSNNLQETLNSYSIILMIVYFLQLQIMGNLGRTVEMINNPENLGELFINFLLYYVNFDYNEKNYIFVRTGLKDLLENDDYLHLNSFMSKLIIIDPLDHKNNVSLKTAEFRNIQFILRLIYYSSRVKCDCSCHYLKTYNNSNNDEEKNNNKDICKKYVELGTEHCILKKIFKTAYRINSNLLKVFN